MDALGTPDWAAIFGALASGTEPEVPYDLTDLAEDAFAVADATGAGRFHVLAASGGAATAAMLASDRPDRIASIVLLMPGSGDPDIPTPADPARLANVPSLPSADAQREAILAYRTALGTALEGSGPRRTQAEIAAHAQASTDRSWNPEGLARSGAAILAAGDLRPLFARIEAPVIVIHGLDDPLVAAQHGRAVAEAIPGARFVGIQGLGHSLPDAVVDEVVASMVEVAALAPIGNAE
jgi:pimeloyl-ACP methyl ester carboxylesterase